MWRDRRIFLKGVAAAATLNPWSAAAMRAPRVVSLDYAAAATLIELGIPPVGLASADRWGRWVVEPPLPSGVVNIGQDLAVNLEVIASLKPDLILTTPYTDALRPRLETIAPVHEVSIYNDTGTPLKNSIAETRRMGSLLGKDAEAERFLRSASAAFDAARARVSALDPHPVAMINFMDQRHARVYGRHSLYQDVLDRIGLENAWQRPTNHWGFATVGLEELAREAPPAMDLLVFEPLIEDIRPTLASSPLWRQMPVVREGRFVVLPPVLMFGMVPAALRFTRLAIQYIEAPSD